MQREDDGDRNERGKTQVLFSLSRCTFKEIGNHWLNVMSVLRSVEELREYNDLHLTAAVKNSACETSSSVSRSASQ